MDIRWNKVTKSWQIDSMNILGISAGFHDAAVSIVSPRGDILFAGHSERYSKIKNDSAIHPDLLKECCDHEFDTVAFYERPWMHNYQQWRSGQKLYGPWTTGQAIRQHLGTWYQRPAAREVSYPHHLSHAAAGFQTSPFNEAAVVVIDAIGEMDTISIFRAWYDDHGCARYQRMWRQGYPHSIGLFYSAVTKAVGLKPMEEEYITMGMAAYGSGLGTAWLRDHCVESVTDLRMRRNLHIGFDDNELSAYKPEDLAAAAQHLTEQMIRNVMIRARSLVNSDNLVYMGGVALNCVANSRLGDIYDNIWIMPNPGDAGSSLGAASLAYGGRLHWRDAFLGHDIPGAYPVRGILDHLITDRIVGVASGRAEWGPRALGNRSLLADPRGPDIKDRVNEIKRRQKFRPFAPVILEECVNDYFEMPRNFPTSRYMQIVARVRNPDSFPAITHADGTARVQTVPQDGSGIRQLLEQWYLLTGCPMLLNTSLNIRGEAMVNDRSDADRFEQRYGVTVCS
jgi:carbamoyltransferase